MDTDLYKERTYQKGTFVWMENSKAIPYFFIVKSGQFKQTLFTLQDDDLEYLNPGDTFGLIACLTGHNYINRLIAIKEFLDDGNIQIHFGQLSITNITKFEDRLKLYLRKERRK